MTSKAELLSELALEISSDILAVTLLHAFEGTQAFDEA